MRPERVNKWPNCMKDMMMMMMLFLYEWKRRSGGKARHFEMTGTQLKPFCPVVKFRNSIPVEKH